MRVLLHFLEVHLTCARLSQQRVKDSLGIITMYVEYDLVINEYKVKIF